MGGGYYIGWPCVSGGLCWVQVVGALLVEFKQGGLLLSSVGDPGDQEVGPEGRLQVVSFLCLASVWEDMGFREHMWDVWTFYITIYDNLGYVGDLKVNTAG